MEKESKKTNDKILETTAHEYLKKDYSVVKEIKNRKILYTGIVKIPNTYVGIPNSADKTIKHTCRRKKYAKENCKREIRREIKRLK